MVLFVAIGDFDLLLLHALSASLRTTINAHVFSPSIGSYVHAAAISRSPFVILVEGESSHLRNFIGFDTIVLSVGVLGPWRTHSVSGSESQRLSKQVGGSRIGFAGRASCGSSAQLC